MTLEPETQGLFDWILKVNSLAVGFEKEMASAPINPVNEVKVNVKPPWSQIKVSGVNVERAGDALGQGAAWAGAAPASAKAPVATNRAALSLEQLFTRKKQCTHLILAPQLDLSEKS